MASKKPAQPPSKDREPTQKQAWLTVGRLNLAENFRPVTQSRVNKIANNFDPDAVGTIVVSQRSPSDIAVLDGQHRCHAFMKMGWEDQKVPCLIHMGLTRADEARIFRELNDNRTKPLPIDLYEARRVEGDPLAKDIDRILEQHDLAIARGAGFGRVQAVSTVVTIFRKAGEEILDQTLAVLTRAWGNNSTSYQQNVLMGVALLLRRNPKLDKERLAKKLSSTTPKAIVLKARTLKETISATNLDYGPMPTVLTGLYNERITAAKRLPAWDAERTSATVWNP